MWRHNCTHKENELSHMEHVPGMSPITLRHTILIPTESESVATPSTADME